MRRPLGPANRGDSEQKLAALQKEFPNHEFVIEEENGHKKLMVDTDGTLTTPEYESMRSIVAGQ